MDEKDKKGLFWKGKKVLVTGGSGFIGGNLHEVLIQLGADVVSVDLNRYSALRNESAILDLCHLWDTERCVVHIQPEIIFHLAAQPIVPLAHAKPLLTLDSNIKGTYNLLDTLRGLECVKTIVVASTDKVYGENLKAQEYSPFKSYGVYEASKICVDVISKTFADQYGMPISITRCGNVYGIGDLHFSRIIPGILKSAFTEQVFEIRSDGHGVREYVYVDDVVDGYLTIAEQNYRGNTGKGTAFNIYSGETIRTIKLVEKIHDMIVEMYGINFSWKVLNEVKEIGMQGFKSSNLFELFDWKPKWRIDKGLQETIKWYGGYYGFDKSI